MRSLAQIYYDVDLEQDLNKTLFQDLTVPDEQDRDPFEIQQEFIELMKPVALHITKQLQPEGLVVPKHLENDNEY